MRLFHGPPLRYRLRRLYRRLRGWCVNCGGDRRSITDVYGGVHDFVARRDGLCYWCAKKQNHLTNYRGVPGGRS